MPSESRTRLDLSGIAKIKARMPIIVKTALIATAIAARDDIKLLCPKDTEQLVDSIHIATTETSDYDQSMTSARMKFDSAKAIGKTPKGRRIGRNETFSGMEPVQPTNPQQVWIICGMPYAITVEYGLGKNPAQPFMRPGLLMHLGTLTGALRQGISGLSVKAKYSEYSKL